MLPVIFVLFGLLILIFIIAISIAFIETYVEMIELDEVTEKGKKTFLYKIIKYLFVKSC